LLILSRILFLSPSYALTHNKNIWKSCKSCNFRTNKPSEKWTIGLLNFPSGSCFSVFSCLCSVCRSLFVILSF
jgi:hypothetical protein